VISARPLRHLGQQLHEIDEVPSELLKQVRA
jgi:hypothetical protein